MGVIHNFFNDKGYGFIRHKEENMQYASEKFFHIQQCKKGFEPLVGKKVLFNLVFNKDNKVMAVDVEDA